MSHFASGYYRSHLGSESGSPNARAVFRLGYLPRLWASDGSNSVVEANSVVGRVYG